uniref:Immunoglobulin V-set domain-containing protein n=1 Tax=Maylandia zebra TaxID=106582 RepID=A0A3P9D754_9CICH
MFAVCLWTLVFSLSSVCVPFKTEESTAVGTDYFFWYRQYPGKPPEFLISHFGTGDRISDPVPGIMFNVSGDKTLMTLQISSAAVTDSAVYYCAVRPTVTGNSKTLYQSPPSVPAALHPDCCTVPPVPL